MTWVAVGVLLIGLALVACAQVATMRRPLRIALLHHAHGSALLRALVPVGMGLHRRTDHWNRATIPLLVALVEEARRVTVERGSLPKVANLREAWRVPRSPGRRL